MNLSNNCIFISGSDLDTFLFKCGIFWAENGNLVWIISPRAINILPKTINNLSSKEILKLIIHMATVEKNDLFLKLNEIHLWYKLPKLIILMDLESYCTNSCDECDYDKAAFLIASLIDASNVRKLKNFEETYIIVSSTLSLENNINLGCLLDLYFTKYLVHNKENENILLEELKEMFSKDNIKINTAQVKQSTSDFVT